MLTSVIIPVFNRPRQLLIGLDSVLKQRALGATKLEIIIVDDHSTPPVDRMEVAGWDFEGGPIKLLRLAENSGPAAARNAGISAASGELIAFLDSDDVWLPDKLARQVAFLKQVTATQLDILSAVTCGFYHPSRVTGRLQGRIPESASNLAEFAGGCWFSPGSTLLLPKDSFSKVGLFDERLRCLEDLDWFIRFGRLGGRLFVVPSPHVIVYRHVGPRHHHLSGQHPPLKHATNLILSKFGPAGPMPLPARARRNLTAYLSLERSSSELRSGRFLRAIFYVLKSMFEKMRPRVSLIRYWRAHKFVPAEVKKTYRTMRAVERSRDVIPDFRPKRFGSDTTCLRLLFCIKALSNPGGGAERVLASVANALVERGHSVAVLTFDPPGTLPYYYFRPEVNHIELGIGSITAPSNLLVTLRRIAALRSHIKQQSPNVVIGFMHSMFIPLALAMSRLPIPLVASEHTVYQHYLEHKLQAIGLAIIPRLASVIACVSEPVQSTYPRFLQKHMMVLPNPVDVKVEVKADTRGRGRNRKLLLAVGRLDSGKDHSTLISAFARIAEQVPDWDLRILGEGPLRRKIERQIADLRLDNRISLPGTTKDISKEYANAQLFVIPSRYESFSLTTVESLAHGLPVIGFSDCLGVNQFIRTGENGILVEPGHDRVTSLANALLPLMQDKESRKSLTLGAKFPDECRLERVIDKWESVLNQLVGKSRLPASVPLTYERAY